tara:strand:- start:206 stop:415 length:210 start_codon:yes stop_codon:yes gene_type:complete
MEAVLTRYKDKMLEVELFVGEQLQDLTNNQVIQAVEKTFGISWVDYAEELLLEFQQELRAEKAVAWEEI